jgi:hypothetical protein
VLVTHETCCDSDSGGGVGGWYLLAETRAAVGWKAMLRPVSANQARVWGHGHANQLEDAPLCDSDRNTMLRLPAEGIGTDLATYGRRRLEAALKYCWTAACLYTSRFSWCL